MHVIIVVVEQCYLALMHMFCECLIVVITESPAAQSRTPVTEPPPPGARHDTHAYSYTFEDISHFPYLLCYVKYVHVFCYMHVCNRLYL